MLLQEELHPNAETMTSLAMKLNELITNSTQNMINGLDSEEMDVLTGSTQSYDSNVLNMLENEVREKGF